ncbi:MAG: 6-bladed beta-propeller [Bacteroidetes bacterium]|jgi:hypothetical protein|nr:6-bladed beta-propeller [Bacteroidota bacterium]
MKSRCILIISLLTLLLFPGILFAQRPTVEFHVKTSITEDQKNFFLGGLLSVTVDENSNIYLTDIFQNSVFKLDSDGVFIDEIVRSGRGPGEVNSIYSVYLDRDKSEFIVADRQNRRMSRLDLDGNEVSSVLLNPNNMNTPVSIEKYDKDLYLFLFSISPMQNLGAVDGVDSFFHVYNLENDERIESFGDRETILESLNYTEGIARARTTLEIGTVELINEDHLLYAPYVYGGKLLSFKKDDEGRWDLSRIIEGSALTREPVIDYDFEEYQRDRQSFEEETPRMAHFVMGSLANAAGLVNYVSGGIYSTSEYILHFLSQRKNMRTLLNTR